jgi:hypothetical protein
MLGKLYELNPVHESRSGYLFLKLVGSTLHNHWYIYFISAVLIWLQGVMLNIVCSRLRISDKKTWYIGLTYVFLASIFAETHAISPNLLSNFLIIAALYFLCSTYKTTEGRKQIFNTGALLGLATLIAPDQFWLIFPFFFAFNAFRKFRLSEQLLYLIGFIVPFFITSAFAYLWNDFWYLREHFGFKIFGLPHIAPDLTIGQAVSGGLFNLLVLIVFCLMFQLSSKTSMQSKKTINFLYWILILGLLVSVFVSPFQVDTLYRCFIPMGVLLGLFIESRKNLAVLEVIHGLLLVGVIINHFWLTFVILPR